MHTMNIGILAHVDAGKTSLAERILFDTHVINELGKVDQGNTQTDAMELERKRGITIKASVVSFVAHGLKINLIDTPGHADFIAEVERSLSVLDGVILVVSAVEGVQAQTKILFSVLNKMGLPTILFVNKIDLTGAHFDATIMRIRDKLTPNAISLCRVEHAGTKMASVAEHRFDWNTDPAFLEQCIELVAEYDEQLLESYVNGEGISEEQVKKKFGKQVRQSECISGLFRFRRDGRGRIPFALRCDRVVSGERACGERAVVGCRVQAREGAVRRKGSLCQTVLWQHEHEGTSKAAAKKQAGRI